MATFNIDSYDICDFVHELRFMIESFGIWGGESFNLAHQ